MSRSLIIAVAAVCGAAAFLWALVARAPRRDSPVVFRQVGPIGARSAGAMRMTPARDLASLEQFVRENNADFQVWFDLAERRHAHGAAAEDAWKKVVEFATEVTSREPQRARAWYALGWASAKLGDQDAARRAYAKAEPLYTASMANTRGNITLLNRLGWIRRGLGDEPGAQEAWRLGETALANDAPNPEPGNLYNLACFRSLVGKPAEALDALTLAVDKGYSDAPWAAHDDDLIPIAHDPRFAELLAKMKDQTPKAENWQEPGGVTVSPAR